MNAGSITTQGTLNLVQPNALNLLPDGFDRTIYDDDYFDKIEKMSIKILTRLQDQKKWNYSLWLLWQHSIYCPRLTIRGCEYDHQDTILRSYLYPKILGSCEDGMDVILRHSYCFLYFASLSILKLRDHKWSLRYCWNLWDRPEEM